MRKKPVFIAILAFMLGTTSTPAYAWGWGPIWPGAHVFDAKRWADSVRETAQMVATIRNEVAKLKNQVTAMLKIDLFPHEMEAAFKDVLKFPDANTIFNPKMSYDPFKQLYRDTVREYERGGDPFAILRTRNADENLIYRNTISEIMRSQMQRQQLSIAIATSEDESLLSEQQKANQLAALEALGSIDEAHMIGASYTVAVKDQETEHIKRTMEREYAKALTVYPYDPYHPTEFDRTNNTSKSKTSGFLKFGQ